MSRIIDLNSGKAMVITDLHGAWDAYQRLRDLFLEQQAKGEVDRFIICGDLIHNEGMEEVDASLDMLLDVMALQAELGKDKVIMLLGNHELPHIYGLTLAKGSVEFTPRFESALTRLDQRYKVPIKRKEVRAFLAGLPFFARTKGGVLITHAGAASDVASTKHVERLLNLEHDDLIGLADRELKKFDIGSLQRGYSHFTGISYDEQAKHYLAVGGANDPRYNELLRVLFLSGQNTDFDLMWNTLFSQNELDVGESAYLKTLKNFLSYFSTVSKIELRVLVSGHISVKDGYAEIGKQQLRMASCTHAFPRKAARYLILDCEKTINSSEDLLPGLRYVFENGDQPAAAAVSVAPMKSA
jgi:hypothetical protein